MQRIWVQLCGKNRYKVTILFMHKRKRGNWVFIDMIKGGLLALLTRFSIWFFNKGGSLLFWFNFYRQTTIKGGNISTMHNHMVEGWNLVHMLLMCEAIPFKWSILQMNCKFKLQFEFKRISYALFSLFTQVNLFKHENRLHIQNPWIFFWYF